jgi:hypothetical protein
MKLKLQIAFLVAANLIVGFFAGVYFTSRFITNFIPELAK